MLHNHVAQRVALHSMLQDCLGFGRFKTHSTKCWGSLHLDCVCVSVNRHSIQVLWLVDAVHEGYLALSVIGRRWPNSVTGSSVQTGIQQNMCWMCTEVYTFVLKETLVSLVSKMLWVLYYVPWILISYWFFLSFYINTKHI